MNGRANKIEPSDQKLIADLLESYFSVEGLKRLSFTLNLKYKLSAFKNNDVQALEFVEYVCRRGKFIKLLETMIAERPFLHTQITPIQEKYQTDKVREKSKNTTTEATARAPHNRKIYRYIFGVIPTLIIIVIAIYWLISLNLQSEPEPTNDIYSVHFLHIQDQRTKDDLPGVLVQLDVEGQQSISQRSDSTGTVILQLSGDYHNKIGKLTIEKEGYNSFEKNLFVEENNFPSLVLLDTVAEALAATATPTSNPTATIPPTSVVEVITPGEATNTPTFTPTHTPIPSTATPTPSPSPLENNKVVAQATDNQNVIYIYAGPGSGNVRLGTLSLGDTHTIIGKDAWEAWYEFEFSQDQSGWVDIKQVEIINGSPEMIPVTFPSTETDEEIDAPQNNNNSNSSSCMSVKLDFTEWPNQSFNDVLITWGNVPSQTDSLTIQVDGSQNGTQAPLIYPTIIDPDESYFIGLWLFDQRGFSPGTTFTYKLTAQTANRSEICVTSGQFTQ